MKVSATPTALELIEDLKKTHGNDLLFHQSGGCCDGRQRHESHGMHVRAHREIHVLVHS